LRIFAKRGTFVAGSKKQNTMAKQRAAQRTVTVTRQTADGETLTQDIHLSKWEAGRNRGGAGNAWENKGWRIVEKKTAPKPDAVKPATPKTETV
jgi:hypothetical protein